MRIVQMTSVHVWRDARVFLKMSASVAAAGGDSLLMIAKLLGHKDTASTERYAHLGDDPLRHAANRISSQIDAAMRGGSSSEVVPLRSPVA